MDTILQQDEKRFASKVALVTGASRGIGFELAYQLGAAGAQVVAVARTLGGLEELDDKIQQAGGLKASLVYLDLSQADQVDLLGPTLFERFGRLDLLCGLAGHMVELRPTWQMDPADWRRCMAVNADANARLIRTCHPLLQQAPQAKALFAGGTAPETGRPFWTAYAASKAALKTIVETYGQEVTSFGIDVELFDPGPTATGLRRKAYPGEDPKNLQTAAQAAAKFLSKL